MRKTIQVVFVDKNLRATSDKKYYFNYNSNYPVKVNDIIVDNRYANRVKVVGILQDTIVSYNGITIKNIQVDEIYSIANAEDYKRAVTSEVPSSKSLNVPLEKAREWYNGDNATLKELALTLYSVDVLELNYEYIRKNSSLSPIVVDLCSEDAVKLQNYAKLCNIAKFFNGTWKKTVGNTGYFIGKSNCIPSYSGAQGLGNGYYIFKHDSVLYPGIVYFKEIEDVKKAFKMMMSK